MKFLVTLALLSLCLGFTPAMAQTTPVAIQGHCEGNIRVGEKVFPCPEKSTMILVPLLNGGIMFKLKIEDSVVPAVGFLTQPSSDDGKGVYTFEVNTIGYGASPNSVIQAAKPGATCVSETSDKETLPIVSIECAGQAADGKTYSFSFFMDETSE